MSTQPAETGDVPQWDVADRLRKSLRQASVEVQEIAEYLGVSRSTISNYINGRIEPSTRTKRLWALRCGVPYEWLCHDDYTPCGPGTPVTAGQHGFITGTYRTPRPFASINPQFVSLAA